MTINDVRLKKKDMYITDEWERMKAGWNWAVEIVNTTDWSKETIIRISNAYNYMNAMTSLMWKYWDIRGNEKMKLKMGILSLKANKWLEKALEENRKARVGRA